MRYYYNKKNYAHNIKMTVELRDKLTVDLEFSSV